jgi:hypothetical protein
VTVLAPLLPAEAEGGAITAAMADLDLLEQVSDSHD